MVSRYPSAPVLTARRSSLQRHSPGSICLTWAAKIMRILGGLFSSCVYWGRWGGDGMDVYKFPESRSPRQGNKRRKTKTLPSHPLEACLQIMASQLAPELDRVGQIDVLESIRQGRPVASVVRPSDVASRDTLLVHDALAKVLTVWPFSVDSRVFAGHVFLPRAHVGLLRDLQGALSRAITNILERWLGDADTNFPSMMPLEEHEENLIRVCILVINTYASHPCVQLNPNPNLQ